MKFTPAQLDNHAIALLADEIDTLPDGVTVGEPNTPTSVSLIRWAEPQHTSVVGKIVFIAHHPDLPAPFDIARIVILDCNSSHSPTRSHRLKSQFRQELAEAIEWITTDDPKL